jgi:hypothetical protein
MATLELDHGAGPANSLTLVNTVISEARTEGCRIQAPLEQNVVVGVDVDEPLSLPQESCHEVLAGFDRQGSGIWFTRVYGICGTFKDSITQNGLFCRQPMLDWVSAAGINPDNVCRMNRIRPSERWGTPACSRPKVRMTDSGAGCG